MSSNSTGALMKTGVIIAAVIIIVRIVLEQLGSPESVNKIFGVVWLHLVLPVFFARRIAAGDEARPFRSLFKNLLLFAVYTRLMVMVTYMLAYVLRWESPRFGLQMGGNVGENIGFLMGFLVMPVRNALIWVVIATVFGMIIGGISLRLQKRSSRPAAA